MGLTNSWIDIEFIVSFSRFYFILEIGQSVIFFISFVAIDMSFSVFCILIFAMRLLYLSLFFVLFFFFFLQGTTMFSLFCISAMRLLYISYCVTTFSIFYFLSVQSFLFDCCTKLNTTSFSLFALITVTG